MAYKKAVFIFIIVVLLAGNTTARAGYLTKGPISEDHNNFYIGNSIGVYQPSGPDQSGFSTGHGLGIRVGYQFIKYFSVEIGSGFENGQFNSSGVKGTWYFDEPLALDFKPILPLSKWDDIYTVLGTGYGAYDDYISSPPPVREVYWDGLYYNIGIGYERYLHDGHLSVSCAVVYHSFSTKEVHSSLIGQTQVSSLTLPHRVDLSNVSLEIWMFWRFFRNKE